MIYLMTEMNVQTILKAFSSPQKQICWCSQWNFSVSISTPTSSIKTRMTTDFFYSRFIRKKIRSFHKFNRFSTNVLNVRAKYHYHLENKTISYVSWQGWHQQMPDQNLLRIKWKTRKDLIKKTLEKLSDSVRSAHARFMFFERDTTNWSRQHPTLKYFVERTSASFRSDKYLDGEMEASWNEITHNRRQKQSLSRELFRGKFANVS